MSTQPHIMCMRVRHSVRVVIDIVLSVGYIRSPFESFESYESDTEKTNVDGSGARSIGPAPCFAVHSYSSRRSWHAHSSNGRLAADR